VTTTHPAAPVPSALFDEPEREARWRARFTAARVSRPSWARDAAHRCVYLSNASGVWEIYAWDRATGVHRRVTNRPHGTSYATLTPDGQHIWWFDDTAGDEFGSWRSEPFDGPPPGDTATLAVDGAHAGYPAGVSIGHRYVAVGAATDDGTTIWLAKPGEPVRVVYTNENSAGVAALSHDGRRLVIDHSEHGDSRHPALRVLSTDDGTTIAEKWDGPGKGLVALDFAPLPGDDRLLVQHERRGRDELLIWHVGQDIEAVIELDLAGDITADWYPDGTSLLVTHTHHARATMHRLDLATNVLTALDTPAGTIGSAAVRPDGAIEYSWSSAAHPPVIRTRATDGSDQVLLEPPGPPVPPSVGISDVFVEGSAGPVHVLVVRPELAGSEPAPTVFSVHGGPHAADEDDFSAYRATWVDAGFTVVHVNYRGSTSYGSEWRDAIEGRPGLTELADIVAAHDWAVRTGLADPACCVLEGASWGGYLTLLGLGTQPRRWAAGIAAVPVADYVTAYTDEMGPLRDFDRALFGGSPDQLPDLYRECSPLTYVDEVRAPVLVLAGENDPRCPIRQIDNYLDRLASRGARYEVYRYDAGHGSLVVDETIKQVALSVDFARRALNLI